MIRLGNYKWWSKTVAIVAKPQQQQQNRGGSGMGEKSTVLVVLVGDSGSRPGRAMVAMQGYGGG